jgi:tetratricopeptide (TPR) repeat protein
LAAAPLVTVLATSRTVLHLTGEYVVPVDPLDVQDAADLFERRAREAGSRLPLYESAGVVRAICARVDALPLAVELAARQIRSLSPQELLKTLDERLPLLAGGPRDLPARQQTLAATLAWSFDLLGEHERKALERLAAFPGGCTAEAAEEICGAGVDTLAALVEHSLLNRIDGEASTRFTMLETVREFALSQLGDDRPEVERRQAEWALALAERAELRGPDQGEWLARLYAEEGNLRGALFWSGVHEAELQVRLASALRRFWWIRGELAEGRRWLEAALAQDVSDPALRANALAAIAGICWSHGDLSAARRYATEAVAEARAGGEAFHEASANTVLGLVAKHEQRFDDARRHLERSIALADEHDLETDVFVGKLNLATVELDAGRLDRAEGLLGEVLAFHEAGDSLEGIGFVLLNLGLVSFRAGDTTQAQERFAGALDAFEHIDFREHLANAMHGLAVVAAAEERYEEAARLFGRADPILRDVGAASFEPELVAEARALLEDELGPERFGELLVDARD